MSLHPGARIGPYEIVTTIGAGGMGEVYRARDTRLNRDVALKVLPDSFANDVERLARFTREAQTLASLNYPHIAAIYGLEEAGGVRALVMELVEGDDLSVLIARGPMPLVDALPIAKQIADALEAAHELGIVHRDLKPANIKVRADGTVKVLDFGLAKAMDPAAQSGVSAANSPTFTAHATQMGIILGTAAYMAPEQARGKAVDRRADIWAFGVVLYEMLTGARAFSGDEISDVLASVLKDDVKFDTLPNDLPPSVRRLLRRCLEKDPRRRLSSIADARLELDEPEAPATTAVATRSAARAPIAIAALVGALATAAVFMLGWPRVSATSSGVTRLSMILPADVPMSSLRALGALSPDGRIFAYIAGSVVAGPETAVWVRPVDAIEARRLAGTEGAGQPFWSPDSRSIGFFQDGKLKTIRLEGGSAETVCAALSGRSGAWSGDTILFAGDVTGPLMRVSSRGGEPVPATTLDTAKGETAHRFAQFLPDGRHFLYVILPAKAGKFDIAIGTLDEPGRKVLMTAEAVPTYAAPGYLLFASRNRIVAQPFDAKTLTLSGEPVPIGDPTGEMNRSLVGGPVVSSSRDGLLAYLTDPPVKTKLAWFDLAGKEQSTVPSPDGYVMITALSGDDKNASVKQTLTDGVNHWIVDLQHGDRTRTATGTGMYDNFAWSRDGRLAFSNDRNGPKDIYITSLEKPSEEQLVLKNNEFLKMPSGWSADGRFILFDQQNATSLGDIFMVPVDGDHAPRSYVQTPADEFGGAVSADNRWLAYVSNESGSYQTYVQSFPTPGPRHHIGAGYAPRWNGNGTKLSWVDPDLVRLWVADVRPGAEFDVGAPRVLGTLPPGNVSALLNSDFTRVLATVPTGNSGGPSVTVVSSWQSVLVKK